MSSSTTSIVNCAHPILDSNGDLVVTGKKYHIREVNEYGDTGSGLTFEVYCNWDYVLLTNSKENPGVGVYFWKHGAQFEAGEVLDCTKRFKLQMSSANWGSHDLFHCGKVGSNSKKYPIWLAKKDWTPINVYEVKNSIEGVIGYSLGLVVEDWNTSCLAVVNDFQGKRWLGFMDTDRCGVNGVMVKFYPAE